ncbi:MAG: hypothetical protein J6T10_06950 [Methanobrevibacter sp.]|nr:hypothetical protein [Methanobrevibacter sp.]
MIVKCKPVYNFQSVEFEYELDPKNENEIIEMFTVYRNILLYMKNVAPEQEKISTFSKPKPKPKPPVRMMSQAQRNWLINLGVDEEDLEDLTYDEASDMIKELKD